MKAAAMCLPLEAVEQIVVQRTAVQHGHSTKIAGFAALWSTTNEEGAKGKIVAYRTRGVGGGHA